MLQRIGLNRVLIAPPLLLPQVVPVVRLGLLYYCLLCISGAMAVALGPGATGTFTNSTQLWEQLEKVSNIQKVYSNTSQEHLGKVSNK